MDKKDDKGTEIIDLGEVKEEDIKIFESGQDSPPFNEETPPFTEDSPPFNEETQPFTEDSPPFNEETPPFTEGSGDEEVPVFEKDEGSKELESTIQRVLELENTLSQLDSSMMVVKKLNAETSEKVSGMEENIQGLVGVYEKITNKMNPFVGEEIQPESSVKGGEEAIPAKTEEDQVYVDEIEEVQGNESQNTVKIMEESGSNGALLEELDNAPSSIMILLKWLDFLLQRVGIAGLVETFEFYENLGWISSNVREKMMKFTGGLNKDGVVESRSEGLKIEDHAISLFFISKINGYDISSSVYPSAVANLKGWEL